MKHDHWIPAFKYQLVNELTKMYPADEKKFRRMGKRQLYAVWFRCWRATGCLACASYG